METNTSTKPIIKLLLVLYILISTGSYFIQKEIITQNYEALGQSARIAVYMSNEHNKDKLQQYVNKQVQEKINQIPALGFFYLWDILVLVVVFFFIKFFDVIKRLIIIKLKRK